MPSSTMANACGSRATLATKLAPRSSIGFLSARTARHFRGRFERGAHNRRIAGATAEMPGQKIADRLFAWFAVFTQENIERHQNARGAKPTLKRVIAFEGGLQNTEAIRRGGEPLDRPQRATIGLHRKHEAGAHQMTVDLDRTGAADAVFTTDMRAGGADLVTQEIREQHARLRLAAARLAVERQLNHMALTGG